MDSEFECSVFKPWLYLASLVFEFKWSEFRSLQYLILEYLFLLICRSKICWRSGQNSGKLQSYYYRYNNHLNTRLVQYSNGGFVSGCQMVWYSNGGFVSGCQMVWYSNSGLKTRLKKACCGPKRPVFEWFTKSCDYHLNTGHPYQPVFRWIRYSDESGIQWLL